MKTLLFNAPAHYVLKHGDLEIGGGETFRTTDATAAELLDNPHVHVTEAPVSSPAPADSGPDLTRLTRDELNALAADAGVLDAATLPNKQAVIDAIES